MKPSEEVTLTLPEDLEQFVRDEVVRGAFASREDYVRELIRERFVKERDRVAKRQAVDAALTRGLADADAGRTVPLDEAFRRLRADLDLPAKKSAG